MGKKSTRENKTFYQLCREEAGLTREQASELMEGVSSSRIEKIEYEQQEPESYDIIQMADCYKRPDICNYYCAHKCKIGERYVPEIKMTDLPEVVLETIGSLNEIYPMTNNLIQISRDGIISDNEIPEFARINVLLERVSLAVQSLNLWAEKAAGENGLNRSFLQEEKSKHR